MKILIQAHEIAKQILDKRQADAILGLMEKNGSVGPGLLRSPQDAEDLVLEPKILLSKIGLRILKAAPAGFRLAIMCRGCDERALRELAKMNQLDLSAVRLVGVACREFQAARCVCQRPYPTHTDVGENVPGIDPFADEKMLELLQAQGLAGMKWWASILQKCIKCYGCRNACPLCVCDPCRLADSAWILPIDISPEPMAFHLIRAFHLADRCVACGACQETCPADIPLLAIQLFLRKVLKERHGYEPGLDTEHRSPLLGDLIKESGKDDELPAWESSLSPKQPLVARGEEKI